MSKQAEEQALNEIYSEIPVIQPSDLELFDMFETFLSRQTASEQGEEIPNLPRGFGQ